MKGNKYKRKRTEHAVKEKRIETKKINYRNREEICKEKKRTKSQIHNKLIETEKNS